ncbi:unnamed protein product, partial [Mesorhabditis spiculigera]
MASIVSSLCLLLVFCLSVEAVFLPNLYQPNEDGMAGAAEKRMSRQALIRLMIQRDRQALGAHGPIKRSLEVDRRSIDAADDFQNCFLSPVQCMISRKRR